MAVPNNKIRNNNSLTTLFQFNVCFFFFFSGNPLFRSTLPWCFLFCSLSRVKQCTSTSSRNNNTTTLSRRNRNSLVETKERRKTKRKGGVLSCSRSRRSGGVVVQQKKNRNHPLLVASQQGERCLVALYFLPLCTPADDNARETGSRNRPVSLAFSLSNDTSTSWYENRSYIN